MSLASRIHGHFHPPDDAGAHDHGHAHAAVDDQRGDASPFWVRHYDRVARIVAFGRLDRLHEGALALGEFKPGLALLDVGCGTGDLILRAESQVDGRGTFVGLDVERGMIDQAKRKALDHQVDVTFGEASIDAIPYPDETFDIVTSSLMFHHLAPEQQRDGLAEIHRVLTPGGRLVVVDINTAKRSVISRLPGHRTGDTTDPLRAKVAGQLRDAGFETVSAGSHLVESLSYAMGTKP